VFFATVDFFSVDVAAAAVVRSLRIRIVVEMKLDDEVDDDDATVEKGMKGCFELAAAALWEEAKGQMICTLIMF
jgi:hypothetical protein